MLHLNLTIHEVGRGRTARKITEQKVTTFIWKSIVCRFGIPHTIIFDNDKQFDNANFKKFYSDLGIRHLRSSPAHPQTNGQVEAINKIIKWILKAKLEGLKGLWAVELPSVLWAYRTTARSSTGETLYPRSFGMVVVVLVEMELPTLRIEAFKKEQNKRGIQSFLDLLEEHREAIRLRVAQH